MKFFKTLFGGKDEAPEDKKKAEEERNFDVLKYDGVKALRAHKPDYAVRCFSHALQMKDDLEVCDYLSQAYMQTGDFAKSYEQLEKLAESQPDNQQIFIRMANVAYLMEDYGAMSASCEKALLIDSKSAEVYYLYARACVGQDDTTNAVAMLTKAISLKEDYGDAYLLRGETLLKAGDAGEADEDASWLLQHAPENEDVLMLKAGIEAAKDNLAAAVEYYNKVSEVNPFNTDAYQRCGEIKLRQGDEAGANAEFEKVKEYAPRQVDGNGGQDIADKVNQAYSNINPMGL